MTDEKAVEVYHQPDYAMLAVMQREAQQFARQTYAERLSIESRKMALSWALHSYGHECFESTPNILSRAAAFHAFLTADMPE